MYRHLVVGTDGSPTATEAVRHAVELARACGASLTVVCAYEEGPTGAGPEVPEDLGWQVTPSAVAEEAARGAASMAHRAGVEARQTVVRGNAAEAIIGVAEDEEADLIVVGSRGMSSPARFLLGNVPNAVSHHAPCDLAIVHTA